VETSMNTKLGPISATYSSQASCPRSCPWYRDNPDEAPCYANHGRSVYTTRRLNRSQERNAYRIALAEAKAIDGLTGDRLLRLHVVGDCRTNASARVLGAAARRYSARGNHPRSGRKVWTYTHAWRDVERSSWTDSVSVLASVERIHDAREAMKRGYAAAIVVGEFQQEQAYPVEGLTVIPCPNQTKGITCRECGLCRNDQRLRKGGLVIAFQAHGRQAASMRKTLMSLSVVLGRIAS
jgi:hypothetical protein